MQRTKEVVDKTNLASCSDIGDFEVKMVMALLGKSDDDMETVASEFVSRYFDPSKGAATNTSSSVAPDDVATPDSSSGMVQFSSSGHAINIGRATVIEAGFKVGSVIGLKKADESSMAKQWQIISINANGSVDLHNVNRDGSIDTSTIVSVAFSDFLKESSSGYRLVVQIELDDRQPMRENPDLTVDLHKAFIISAMHRLMKMSATWADKFRIQTKPTKAVMVISDAAVGCLKMLPVATQTCIRRLDPGEPVTDRFTITVVDSDDFEHLFALSTPGSKKFVDVAFVCKFLADTDKSNMKIEHENVIIKTGGFNVTVKYPIVVSTVDLKADTELVIDDCTVKKDPKRKVRTLHVGVDKQQAKGKKVKH